MSAQKCRSSEHTHRQNDCFTLRSRLRMAWVIIIIGSIIRSCPPSILSSSYTDFDTLIQSSLADIVGAPLSQWPILKASLPTSMGVLGLREAKTHSPAAFYGSLSSSTSLLEDLLGHPPDISPLLDSVRPALATNAARSDWVLHSDFELPCSQRSLSHSIDVARYSLLLDQALDSLSKALARSSSIPLTGFMSPPLAN